MTKWKRLFNALAAAQNQHRLGNHLILLINRAMDPGRLTGGATNSMLCWHFRIFLRA